MKTVRHFDPSIIDFFFISTDEFIQYNRYPYKKDKWMNKIKVKGYTFHDFLPFLPTNEVKGYTWHDFLPFLPRKNTLMTNPFASLDDKTLPKKVYSYKKESVLREAYCIL